MIDRNHALPITRQAKALGVSRSSVYYIPRPVPAEDLKLMRRLDELHLDHPYAGARMLRDLLRREGVAVGRRHVSSLMKRMGIEAIYRRPNTSKPAPGHKIYPYLLHGVKIERPNLLIGRNQKVRCWLFLWKVGIRRQNAAPGKMGPKWRDRSGANRQDR